jgi:hypothetical protein
MDNATKELLKKAMGMLEDTKNIVLSVHDEARDIFDELTEKQQESKEGEKMSDLIDILDGMDNDLDNIISSLGNIINEK